MAKGLGSGLPISAIGARKAVMEKWEPGSHGGTYGGGSAVACAAALATIEVIANEDLAGNAVSRGEQLRNALTGLQNTHPEIGEVRGKGLMVGVEFITKEGRPAPELVSALGKACLEKGLLLLSCGTWKNVIRWIPPLVVSREEIDQAVELFREALEEVKSMCC